MKNKFPSLNLLTTLLDAGISNTIDILMYKLLLLENKIEEDIVVDFVATQKRINKMCKKYGLCKVTVKRSLKRLASHGLIKIIYDVAFGKMVVHVLPFAGLIDRHNEPETNVSDVIVERNEPLDETGQGVEGIDPEKKRIRQQQLIYASQKTKAAGIVFQKKDLWKIAKHPKELIDRAIACFKAAQISQSTFIRNPAGWLISCLEKKYYTSYRFEKVIGSLEQQLFDLQDQIIELTGSLSTRQLSLFPKKMIPRPT